MFLSTIQKEIMQQVRLKKKVVKAFEKCPLENHQCDSNNVFMDINSIVTVKIICNSLFLLGIYLMISEQRIFSSVGFTLHGCCY